MLLVMDIRGGDHHWFGLFEAWKGDCLILVGSRRGNGRMGNEYWTCRVCIYSWG